MGLSRPHKTLVLVLMTIACIFVVNVKADGGWGWGWSSDQPGSSWGWGSDSGSGSGSSNTGDSDSGPGWGWSWGWGSNQTGSGWSWGWGWGSDGSGGSSSGSGSSDSGWDWGWWGSNAVNEPRKIVVGGSAGWQYGFNYTEWALNNTPFYVNDTLVFKYDPPAPRKHNVYLLHDPESYMRCNMTNGTMVGKEGEGVGEGFNFVLGNSYPYYFVCSENGGVHCINGTMKFTVTPILRSYN